MGVTLKLGGYALALALVGAGAWAVGQVAGPVAAEPAVEHGESGHDEAGQDELGHGAAGHDTAALPGGLASALDGYALVPESTSYEVGTGQRFGFRITGPDGEAVTAFDEEHEKLLHLIAVRRDTAAFQHVHPELGPDGTWSVPLDLAEPGSYRVFADFHPSGAEAMTLAVDVSVAGEFRPVGHPPAREATVDGYRVRLDGELRPGQANELTATFTKDGRPVPNLEPYLGAFGHLVALREGDLAYLHVHPDGAPGDGRTEPGPTVKFLAEVPSAGTYRLFVDFRHEGQVRTAEFTVHTDGHGNHSTAPSSGPAPGPGAHG